MLRKTRDCAFVKQNGSSIVRCDIDNHGQWLVVLLFIAPILASVLLGVATFEQPRCGLPLLLCGTRDQSKTANLTLSLCGLDLFAESGIRLLAVRTPTKPRV